MTAETTSLSTKLRTTALAIAFGFGVAASGPVVAQADTAPQVVAQVDPLEEDVVEEEDEGFDWGWLGLLGLAGLAGLAKRGNTESRTVERTTPPRV